MGIHISCDFWPLSLRYLFAIFYNYLLLNWVAKRDPFKSLMLCCSELYRAAVADNLEEIKMLREKWQMTELSCSCDCEKITCQLVCIGCQAVTAIRSSFPADGWKQSSKPSRASLAELSWTGRDWVSTRSSAFCLSLAPLFSALAIQMFEFPPILSAGCCRRELKTICNWNN